MPQSIPEGLTRAHVELAMAEIDAGITHSFGLPTGYEMFVNGRSYAPKAIVGLALRHVIGRSLLPQEFASGVAPGQAVYVLRNLGFEVRRMSDDWTLEEIHVIVADYFDMLRLELVDHPYSKTEHRNRLAPKLHERSNGSIEFKHQNISAVLVQRELPYIEGYKPRGNFQNLLGTAVDEFLDAHPGYLEGLTTGVRLDPPAAPTVPLDPVDGLFVSPPEKIAVPGDPPKPWLSRRGSKIDFARKDAENRRLGRLGEEWVVEVERRRLRAAGRDDLAEKVEWVAQSQGDGLGFDVLSFDHERDTERFVEVKTTGLGKFFPFLVTANEMRCSEDVPERFHLYRVFTFGTAPKLYVLAGALSQTCDLRPTTYAAHPKGASEP